MEKKKSLKVNDKNASKVYTNLVSFNVNPEEVCLGLGVREVQNQEAVDVHTYAYFSIPHFLRFADTVSKHVELLVEKGVISRETEQ